MARHCWLRLSMAPYGMPDGGYRIPGVALVGAGRRPSMAMQEDGPIAGDHVIVWRYRVGPDSVAAFERAYGPDGPWVQLFRRHPGFRGSELVRGNEPGVYLTIDRWEFPADFEAFLRQSGEDYERLDADLASLTVSEELVARGRAVEPVT